MARVLIVGCGCRGRELAGALAAAGHAVRGTSRSEAALPAIEAAGAESVLADPDRLATLTQQLEGVSVLCWLLGSADNAALHGPRLESLLELLVDTHVRGVVYEGSGEWGGRGAELVRRAAETYRMPGEVVAHDPADHAGWLRAMTEAVERVLTA
ncbi:MAG: NAD(P)H-binding protein [Thermoleophilaceae bacterium]